MSIAVPVAEPSVLTIAETARLLKLSQAKVYQLAMRGEIPSFRVDRSVRIRADRLQEWVDQRSR